MLKSSSDDDNRSDGNFFIKLFERLMKADPGRSKIMEVVRFRCSIKFENVLSKHKNIIHIGSGSYADVYRSRHHHHNHGYILKLICLLPETILTRIQSSTISRTTSYIDAYNEYQISSALSKLQQKKFFVIKNRIYSCGIFPQILCCYLTNEGITNYLKAPKSFSDFDHYCYSDHFEDYLPQTVLRENLVICMEDCGDLMIDIIEKLHPYALLSILKQIISGLMIAEQTLEFEHRDLHSGNILLQHYEQQSIRFIYDNQTISIPSYGYQVKIIDTTFSRLKFNNIVYYKDMTCLFENFEEKNNENKKMKMQDLVYGQMAQIIQNNWQNFHPKTNCLWMKYVIYKLMKSLSSIQCRSYQSYIKDQSIRVKRLMEEYNRLLDKCSNLFECFDAILRQPGLNDYVRISVTKLNF